MAMLAVDFLHLVIVFRLMPSTRPLIAIPSLHIGWPILGITIGISHLDCADLHDRLLKSAAFMTGITWS
jgi:hypothetical protein